MSRHPSAPATPALLAPSAEVRSEALARARRLAVGLFPHQVEGVAFLLGRRRAILADDMGLGKTRQSIVALTEAAPVGPWLVVAPASVKRNWAREIEAARPGALVHIVGPDDPPDASYDGWVVVNYDLLPKHIEALVALPWTGLVFDEAHYLKNHRTKRSRLARAIVSAAPAAVLHALTGTPLTNRPRDLFPLLQLANHPMGRSFLSFAKRYCAAYHNGFGWVTDGASNLDELRIQFHGLMLRRTKGEVLDLPPKVRTWVPVTVPDGTARAETRRVIETLIAGSLARARGGATPGAEAAPSRPSSRSGKARRNEPGQDRVRLLGQLSTARRLIARAKTATTIEFVEGVVAQGEKAIVFSSFDEPAKKIAAHFGDRAVLLTGATPARRRQKLVDRFQGDETVRVFVANLVAGGVGLNLTAARQVVFNDLDWVPANHWQAEDRAYRIGQRGSVSVTYFTASGTLDEFVARTLEAKAMLIEAVVEGRGGAPVAGDVLAELEALVSSLSPGIATLADAESDEDPVDRLLREVTRAARETDSVSDATGASAARERLRRLPREAFLALVRSLAGPVQLRYAVSSRRAPGTQYVLDVDGGTVACSCYGFEYRGACRHARVLTEALATRQAPPEEFRLLSGGA